MRFERLLLIPAALASVACIEGQRVIKLRADGSGTIVDTVTLGEQAREMMTAMAAMDQTAPTEKKAKQDAKLKARAEAMGPGVSLVSYVPRAKTSPETLTYAFKDITKIKIEPSADSAENDSQSEPKNPLTFRFEKKGSGGILTVLGAYPQADPTAAKPAAATKEAAEVAAKMQAQAMDMMKTMLKGLKMTTLIEVDGKVLKTSSPWSDASTVTVLAIDFDQVAADEASMKRLSAMGDPSTVDAAALKGIQGIKVQPTPELTIEFAK